MVVFKKAKLFWKKENMIECICSVPYDETVEYYTFLRNCKEKGYRQVIVTSEIMLQIIRKACLEKSYIVYKIEFAEEDLDLEQDIQDLIQITAKNSAYFGDLVEKIKIFSEQSSIDLRRVYIKGAYEGSNTPRFFLQSNGILGTNKESYESLSKEISTIVERCLTG
jgi:hypothetical protein